MSGVTAFMVGFIAVFVIGLPSTVRGFLRWRDRWDQPWKYR